MRRIVLWALSTVSVIALLFAYGTSTAGPLATRPSTSIQSQPAISSSGTGDTPSSVAPAPSASASAAPTTRAKARAKSSSRTVTGQVADTQWGPVQVRLAIASGKITQVSVVQYPAGNGRDDEINSYALPILTKETISAQSAQIDMVSGATVTSDGYLQSLQSALDQAGL